MERVSLFSDLRGIYENTDSLSDNENFLTADAIYPPSISAPFVAPQTSEDAKKWSRKQSSEVCKQSVR
jgi:hypothetical protein